MHIGEPKTGTTFLQHAIWGNRGRLASQGVMLPGYTRRDHTRGSRDLRDAQREANDPADPWNGEWDVLARQALKVPGAAVISDELLAMCTPAQADRAVRSLLSAELHVILTVRDFTTLLPAEWQENIKIRRSARWEDWLSEVIDLDPAVRRRRSRFWAVHETLTTLSMWSQHLPPDRVHVITVPRSGSSDLLWERFASVIGIDPARADLSQARSNPSLGLAETEFMRRLNESLREDVPDWYYTRYIKQILSHEVLTTEQRGPRPALPPGRQEWALQQAEELVAGLRDAKYHIAGDLDELRPQPASTHYAAPDQQSAEDLAAVALRAAVALADSRYREMYPPARTPDRKIPRPRLWVSRLRWTMLNGPWARKLLRKGSHLAAVRGLRASIWWVLMRPKDHRHMVAAPGEHSLSAPSAAWLAGGRPNISGLRVPTQPGTVPAQASTAQASSAAIATQASGAAGTPGAGAQ